MATKDYFLAGRKKVSRITTQSEFIEYINLVDTQIDKTPIPFKKLAKKSSSEDQKTLNIVKYILDNKVYHTHQKTGKIVFPDEEFGGKFISLSKSIFGILGLEKIAERYPDYESACKRLLQPFWKSFYKYSQKGFVYNYKNLWPEAEPKLIVKYPLAKGNYWFGDPVFALSSKKYNSLLDGKRIISNIKPCEPANPYWNSYRRNFEYDFKGKFECGYYLDGKAAIVAYTMPSNGSFFTDEEMDICIDSELVSCVNTCHISEDAKHLERIGYFFEVDCASFFEMWSNGDIIVREKVSKYQYLSIRADDMPLSC